MSTSLITPSYAADFERCRLLCDSVDRFIGDTPNHFILVNDEDYPQFAALAGPRRYIVNELDILPSWLHCVKTGLSQSSRKLWVSRHAWPMRGWHVQQLRRIAIAKHVSTDGLLYCDSDMLFVKPFTTDQLWNEQGLRLYRKSGGINSELPDGGTKHIAWTNHAAKLNGLLKPRLPAHDYINNLVSWRREHVISMCHHIEEITGKHWIAALGARRSFSECQIYGAYVDDVLKSNGHWHGDGALCQTYWSGEALTRETVSNFIDTMSDGQVAIGIQSFTGTNPLVLRDFIAA